MDISKALEDVEVLGTPTKFSLAAAPERLLEVDLLPRQVWHSHQHLGQSTNKVVPDSCLLVAGIAVAARKT